MKYRTQIISDREFILRITNFINSLEGTLKPFDAATLYFGKKNKQAGGTLEGPLRIEPKDLERLGD